MNTGICLLSGTPGTGKTTIAKRLETRFGYERISLGEVVENQQLYSNTDSKRNTKIVDKQKFHNYFQKKLQNISSLIIIEGHYADMIRNGNVKMGIILRCHPHVLENRLKKRNYSKEKIQENVQAELLGDSTSYMLEHPNLSGKKKIFEIDTSKRSLPECVQVVANIIQNPLSYKKFKAGKITWLSDPSVDISRYQHIF